MVSDPAHVRRSELAIHPFAPAEHDLISMRDAARACRDRLSIGDSKFTLLAEAHERCADEAVQLCGDLDPCVRAVGGESGAALQPHRQGILPVGSRPRLLLCEYLL